MMMIVVDAAGVVQITKSHQIKSIRFDLPGWMKRSARRESVIAQRAPPM